MRESGVIKSVAPDFGFQFKKKRRHLDIFCGHIFYKACITRKCPMKENLKKYSMLLMVLCVIAAGTSTYLSRYAEVSSNVNGRELPIYCVQTDEKKVALSFDAAWGNEDTQQILDILAKYNVHVTFFMTGGWVENYPDDVKRIYEAGHDLGNHSETHPNMSRLSDEEQKQEIMAVHEKVKELTGVEMELFRPPYGDYNNAVVLNARACGYYPIQWDVDSLDWKDYGAESIIDTVVNHKNLQNGSIILCHNGAKYTAQALEQVICGLQEKGYEIVPISELIYREDYHMDVTGRQIKN